MRVARRGAPRQPQLSMPASLVDTAPSARPPGTPGIPALTGDFKAGEHCISQLQCAAAADVDQGLEQLLQTLMALTQARHVHCTLVDIDRRGVHRPLATATAGLCTVDEPPSSACRLARCHYEISAGRQLVLQFHLPKATPGLNVDGVMVLLCAVHRWLIWLDLSHGPVHDTGVMPVPHRKVLLLMLKGLSEKQIAADLGLSINTAHRYVTLLYRRYGVRNRASLMALWLKPPA